MDYSIKVGGEAGQGIQTIGDTLAKVFARSGYYVFSHQDYESRIRGGHNFFQVRLSDRPVMASRASIDILVALDQESVRQHENELSAQGLIVGEPSLLETKREPHFLSVPFTDLARQSGGQKIMANTVAIGSVLGMLGLKIDIFNQIIKDTFYKKGAEIVNANLKAALAGHAYALEHCLSCSFAAAPLGPPKLLISGNEAVALGALASGLKFYAGYPMTPATSIMQYIASKALDCGIIVEQAEDEIAAINLALGASFAGVRSMTGSSGGGFALMVEGLSLAAMTETPLVIVLAQRPGPATGFPTRTEQADLLFSLHAAHGEFPRVIFAPGTAEQAFYLTNKAFDLTEKYQIPVIILTDQYLADSQWSLDGFNLEKIKYKDYRLRSESFENLPSYRRHELTESGVSPLGVPGEAKHIVVTDSDEHDEEGHLVEDAETRIKMANKRYFRKWPLVEAEIDPPEFYGHPEPEVVITGWGSTYGVIKEVVDELSQNRSVACLHFRELYPFPLLSKFNYLNILSKAKITICVENNATGQFARFMRAETGFKFHYRINKYDGRPFLLEGLKGEVDAILRRL